MSSYRCFFLNVGDEPSAPSQSIELQASNADQAAHLARTVTGCETVTDVIRQDD